MHKLNSILENQSINKLIAEYKRSPQQINNPHESDAEIIKFNDSLLAITTDSISEEIATGLYDDQYLIGWMTVTVNMSDLAAVGASPLGILISQIIPKNFEAEKIMQLQRGISDACEAYNTFVLGGDINEGDKLILTGTAIGSIVNKNPVSRLGCKSSDILYSSSKLGSGNAYAISKLISKDKSTTNYKPLAQIKYSNVISKYASSCMDTSDGLIATLDQLERLNEIGFELNADWQNSIDDDSLAYAKYLDLPVWFLLAGQHGEFELIFTVPKKVNENFIEEAQQIGFTPIEFGKVISENEIKIPLFNNLISIDTTLVRNLPLEADGNVNYYLQRLLEYDNQLKT